MPHPQALPKKPRYTRDPPDCVDGNALEVPGPASRRSKVVFLLPACCTQGTARRRRNRRRMRGPRAAPADDSGKPAGVPFCRTRRATRVAERRLRQGAPRNQHAPQRAAVLLRFREGSAQWVRVAVSEMA